MNILYTFHISVSSVWYNVFFMFRDSYVLCIYVINILCTFHIPVSWVWYNVFFVFRDSYVLCIYVMNILYTFQISVPWVLIQRVFRVSGFLCSMYICYEYSMYVSHIRSMGMVQTCFFGFRDSYVLCIYVMNILCTFHISVSWVWYNVFFGFRDSYVVCIYVMNILYTFHSYPYHGYGTTCFSCFGIPMFYVYML